MTLAEKKSNFISLWGTLGSNWGISRTMAQIHALLLISKDSLSTEQIMEELSISRGNTNLNVRELVSWGLVYKEITPGDRKEYFRGESDVWVVAKRIISERKKREIHPLQRSLQELKDEKYNSKEEGAADFHKKLDSILLLITRMDKASNALLKLEENAIVKTLLSITK